MASGESTCSINHLNWFTCMLIKHSRIENRTKLTQTSKVYGLITDVAVQTRETNVTFV